MLNASKVSDAPNTNKTIYCESFLSYYYKAYREVIKKDFRNCKTTPMLLLEEKAFGREIRK